MSAPGSAIPSRRIVVACCLWLIASVSFAQTPLRESLWSLPAGADAVRVQARDGGGTVALALDAIEPFTADAKLVLVAADGSERLLPRPDVRYFRVRDARGAAAGMLALPHAGEGVGVVALDGISATLRLTSEGRLQLHRVSDIAGARDSEPFQCGNDDVPRGQLARAGDADTAAAAPTGTPPTTYRARVAIETDDEFLGRFSGDTDAATSYVGALMAYISSIYEAEVDTQLQVSFLRLWETAAPYTQTSTGCALLESGKYWNDNEDAVDRTLMHFLSGRTTLAGIAWIGVLCSGEFATSPQQIGASCTGIPSTVVDNFGGAYGVTMGVSGSFDAGDPQMVWDFVAVAHEIGHNFNSPHAHCYNGLGGNAQPVDQCYSGESGCYAGTTSLPGAPGTGSGTLMSYCHLRSPGLTNIAPTFGLDHPFGVAPERVPSRMLAHVQNRAISSPACLLGLQTQAPLSVEATPAALTVGAAAALSTSGGSGTGAVTYALTAGDGICALEDATLTALAAGSCEVTATKAGDAQYESASATVDVPVELAEQAPLTAIATPSTIPVGGDSALSTEGGSGTGAVSFAITGGDGGCTLSGSTLSGVQAGACEVTATKAADDAYRAATDTVAVQVVRQSQEALVLEATPSAIVYGGSATLSVSGGSGSGPVALEVTAGGDVCQLDADTLVAIGVGDCTVTATKAGDDVYEPASTDAAIGVSRAPQAPLSLSIAPSALAIGDRATLTPQGGSGSGAVEFAITAGETACAIDAGELLALDAVAGGRTCTVTATKAQDAHYAAATASADATVFPPGVDLALAIDRVQPPPGATLTGDALAGYRLAVTNHGPTPAHDVSLRVDRLAGLDNSLWTCTAPSGDCAPPDGDAIVDTRFDLGVGATATVELSGTPDAAAGYVEIDASTAPADGVPALNPADDRDLLVDPIGNGNLFRSGFE